MKRELLNRAGGKRHFIGLAAALIAGAGLVSTSLAQQGGGPGGGGGGGGGFGGQGGFDPARIQQMIADLRQQAADQMKAQLEASDDDWKVIQPRLDKVESIMLSNQTGTLAAGLRGRGGAGGRGGPAGFNVNMLGALFGGGDNTPQPVAERTTELLDLLDNKEATPEQITAKMAELRAAKAKLQTDLIQARKNLVEVLSQRQEAILVQLGVLE